MEVGSAGSLGDLEMHQLVKGFQRILKILM
jgi:hypothetical protein